MRLDFLTDSCAAYFEHVHPIWPFLDRKAFEAKLLVSSQNGSPDTTPAFSALYHAVMALGSMYRGGGDFDPESGRAWPIFQVALGLVPELLIPHETVVNVQVGCLSC